MIDAVVFFVSEGPRRDERYKDHGGCK